MGITLECTLGETGGEVEKELQQGWLKWSLEQVSVRNNLSLYNCLPDIKPKIKAQPKGVCIY